MARDANAAASDAHVVAVIGDGALTGGLAYEALNNLGYSGRRVVVILNDNGRSYAPTVSRLTASNADAGDVSAFVGALGIAYDGPIDGHDLDALESAFRDAAGRDGPVVVHVLTRKGEGYPPAETDDEKRLHDIGAFDPETGVQHGKGVRRRTPRRSRKRSSTSVSVIRRSSRSRPACPVPRVS